MKQFIIRIAILSIFAATLFSCIKENAPLVPEQEGSEFTLHLLQTKTVNNGYSTEWAKGDKVNVFHAEAAPIHILADQYQSKDGDMAHLAGSYCPLAGKTQSVAANAAIVVTMQHLVAVLKIKVTNYEEDPMDLNLVSFRTDGGIHENEDVTLINSDSQTITGSFEVDFTGKKLVYNQVNKGLGSGTSRPLIHLKTPETLGLNESATVFID
ncbi:MAG: hypothetical protein IKW27_00245 [Bacteroidales bacterium]|nr:hypothetical protein [Bacteroidales bacterium]